MSDFTFYHVSNVCLGHVFGLEDLPEHGHLDHAAVLGVKHPAVTWYQVRINLQGRRRQCDIDRRRRYNNEYRVAL